MQKINDYAIRACHFKTTVEIKVNIFSVLVDHFHYENILAVQWWKTANKT